MQRRSLPQVYQTLELESASDAGPSLPVVRRARGRRSRGLPRVQLAAALELGGDAPRLNGPRRNAAVERSPEKSSARVRSSGFTGSAQERKLQIPRIETARRGEVGFR